jgi:subtilisin family serine protease
MKRAGSLIDQDGTIDTDPGVLVLAAAEPSVSVASLPTGAPYFSQQWYLQNTGQNDGTPGKDIDVVPAWNIATGAGITVVVNDVGVDYTNPDIAPNYDAATSQSLDPPYTSGYPATGVSHGTSVAGLIAAAGVGIIGVAYNATVSSYRLIGTNANASNPWGSTADALLNTENFDVANNSWAFTGALEDSVFNNQTTIATNALLTAATDGRGGLGTINVFAGGNGYASGDDTNLHAFQSSINVVTVAALDDNGTVNAPGGRYSSRGTTILVSAPGTGILSDTIVGTGDTDGGDLQSALDGTSFAAPLVTGVVALMLQANPNLGIRDVQQILAYSARLTDPTDPTWLTNAATNWNGGGLHVSPDYGFGLVDAAAAVALAQTWPGQHTIGNRTIDDVNANAVGAIASSGSSFSFTVPAANSLTLNWARVQLEFYFTTFDNLVVTLTSPGGVSSVLLDQPNGGIGASYFNNTIQLTSDEFWGQNSVGTWTVSFSNANPALGSTGSLYSASLVLVGDPPPAGTNFVYTNEYPAEASASPSREVLSDPSGSGDMLDLAAVSLSCTIDLIPGQSGNIGGTPFSIASGTTINKVIVGSGIDDITGQSGDTVQFPDSMSAYTFACAAPGEVSVTANGVTDMLTSIATLQFANGSIPAISVECFAAGTLIATVDGERPVEDLCVGDRVLTWEAMVAPSTNPPLPSPTKLEKGEGRVRDEAIVAIQRRSIDCARHPNPRAVWPVRIAAGAFGVGRPKRDLLLSPDHAVHADGVLIPVKHLINGTTIRQEAVEAIDYFHIELPRHDLLLAEGLPVESYLPRGQHEFMGCAPLVVTGPALATARGLLARAA